MLLSGKPFYPSLMFESKVGTHPSIVPGTTTQGLTTFSIMTLIIIAHYTVMLSVANKPIMMSGIRLNVIILNVIMLNQLKGVA